MTPAPAVEVTIQCAEGSVVATPIKLWRRDENLERTAADTVRNVVVALFEAQPLITRIGMVLTRGSVPLLICEAGDRWFHVGANPALKPIALRALRSGYLPAAGGGAV